jgi:hypothetical protein
MTLFTRLIIISTTGKSNSISFLLTFCGFFAGNFCPQGAVPGHPVAERSRSHRQRLPPGSFRLRSMTAFRLRSMTAFRLRSMTAFRLRSTNGFDAQRTVERALSFPLTRLIMRLCLARRARKREPGGGWIKGQAECGVWMALRAEPLS